MTNLNVSGLKMGLEELAKLIKILELRERQATEVFAKAEQDILSCRKLLGFVRTQQTEYRERLAMLEEQS